jgi:hypothetical protein
MDPKLNKFGAVRNAMPFDDLVEVVDLITSRNRKGETVVKIAAEMVYRDLGLAKGEGKGRGRPAKAKKG